MSEKLGSADLPVSAISHPTVHTAQTAYRWPEFWHSLSRLMLLVYNSGHVPKAYSEIESWETSNWKRILFLIGCASSGVYLPFQLYNTIRLIRQYDPRPNRRRELRFTIMMLSVGACGIIAGSLAYFSCQDGQKRSLTSVVVIGISSYFAVLMPFVVPYAYFQYHHMKTDDRNISI